MKVRKDEIVEHLSCVKRQFNEMHHRRGRRSQIARGRSTMEHIHEITLKDTDNIVTKLTRDRVRRKVEPWRRRPEDG